MRFRDMNCKVTIFRRANRHSLIFTGKWMVSWILFFCFCLTLQGQENRCVKGDCRNGKGTFRWLDGNVYNGLWKNALPEGKGKMTFANNGGYYIGEWKNGFFHGIGRRQYANGSYYEGVFAFGLIQGFGKKKYVDGRIYKGQWKSNYWQGKGELTWSDGSRYKGQFRKGRFVGRGSYNAGSSNTSLSISWGNKSEVCIISSCTKLQAYYLNNQGIRRQIAKNYGIVDFAGDSKLAGYFTASLWSVSNLNSSIVSSQSDFITSGRVFEFNLRLGHSKKRFHLWEIGYNFDALIRNPFNRLNVTFIGRRLQSIYTGYAYMLSIPRKITRSNGTKSTIQVNTDSVGVGTGMIVVRANNYVANAGGTLSETTVGFYVAFYYLAGFLAKSKKYETSVGFSLRQNFFFATNLNSQSIVLNSTHASPLNGTSFFFNIGTRF